MQNNAIISAKDISVGYGRITVAGGISFDINAGEILTIIGANGAGKSTILKTIAAQLPIMSGAAYIDGKNISSINEKSMAKQISLVLTERICSERMTCRDIIATGRYPYTGRLGILSGKDSEIVDEAMELAGISHLKDRDFRFISDGQRQCVMIARAIAQQPTAMLLDEPTSFLDIDRKLELLTLLRKLSKEKNIAVIQTLHELDLAQRFSDKILCIKNKKADKLGIPEDIFTDEYITNLYGIKNGNFNGLYGVAEPTGISGDPLIYVIGGGGTGINLYRRLWRLGIPFAAGILHENDIEIPVAKVLAAQLITEKAFEPICQKSIEKSLEAIKRCRHVVCCISGFGTINSANKTLVETAEKMGKIISAEEINDTYLQR